MGKKVGCFTDPSTGEMHYLDSDFIEKEIILSPQVVNTLNDDTNKVINFKLRYEKDLDEILLSASLKYEENTIKSHEISIEAEEFARAIFDCIQEGEDIFVDEKAIVKEAKRAVIDDIMQELMSQGIVLTNISLSGIGFIKVKNDKLITIDEIYLEKRNGKVVITLKNCIGIVQLANLSNPSMIFYSNNVSVTISNFSLLDAKEGRLKEYTIVCENADVTSMSMPEEYLNILDPIDTEKIDNEDYLNEIASRKMQLLHSATEEDDSLEQMLDDIIL